MSAAVALFPSCREVTGLLSEFMEGQLGWPRSLGLRLHLGMCPACQRILDSLRALPALLKQSLAQADAQAPDRARQALEAAMARIGQPRTRRLVATVPAAFAESLAAGRAGPTLRIMAEAQRGLLASGPVAGPPFLAAEVLAQLPPPEGWKWLRPIPGGARIARLQRDDDADLFLLGLRPGGRFPRHVHHGGESLLLLHGGLEDQDRHLGPGEWAVHAAGSTHAPVADRQGCWALARLEGEVTFSGWLGLLQRWSG